MQTDTRRALLRGLAGCGLVAVGGCLAHDTASGASPADATGTGTTGTSTSATAATPDDSSDRASSATADTTRTDAGQGAKSGDGPFDDLDPSDAPTRCLRFDYSSYATTPVPSPTPTVPSTDTDAVTLASAFERAYLHHWAVTEYGPLNEAETGGDGETATATASEAATADRTATADPTPNAPAYPTVERETERRDVLQRTADGVVVRLQYRRRIVETGDRSRRTVVYYLTDAVAVRAATAGYVTPGPHPTRDGVRLTCAE